MPQLSLPDGHTIIYDDAGKGSPALLMAHGYTGGRWYYERDVPVFSEKYRCVAPDLIGHGDSSKPVDRIYNIEQFAKDIDDFAKLLKLDRFVIIGHSMGGMIAQLYALDFNEHRRCVGLVLISTASEMVLRDVIARLVRSDLDRYEKGQWKANMESERALARSAWSPAYAEAHPEQVDSAFREVMRIPDIVRLKLMLALAEFDVTKRVKEISLPVMVCVGSVDILAEGAYKLAQAIPHARFKKIENAGHMINFEATQAIQREISDFLEENFSQ